MSTPLVSVVVPTFNRAAVVGRALHSVAAQTMQDYELIVVDDGSTDGTADVLARMADQFGGRWLLLRTVSNRGAAHARNAGVAAARGKYVAFLDADDEWLPTKLATQVAAFERAPITVGLITTRYTLLDYHGHCSADHPRQPREGNIAGAMRDFLSGRGEIVGVFSTLIFRRELFERVGRLDESLMCWEDADFYCRAADHAEFAFVPEVLTHKFHSADSTSENWFREAKGVTRFWQKHRRRFGASAAFRRYIAWHQHSVGIQACLAGDLAYGRRLFAESIRIWPGYLQPVLHLLLSFFGVQRYRAVWSGRRGQPIDHPVSLTHSR